jgi:PAS domain S-box-containing protein
MSARPSPKDLFTQAELSAALRAADVGVWALSVPDGRLRWSPEMARLVGLPLDRLEGQLDELSSLVCAEDRELVSEAGETLLRGETQEYSVEYRVPLSGGGMRWVASRGRLLFDGRGEPEEFTGATIDVTERRTQLEQCSEGEKRLRLFSELASDYVYEVDLREPALAPSIVAGSFERTTGYTPQEVAEVGGWFQVIHPDDRGNLDELFAQTRAGKRLVNEYRIVRKDGEQRWLRDRIVPVMDPETGELVRLVGGVQDITDLKELESQLIHSQKMEALARMAGAVAHDFNNLLTVMYGTIDTLEGRGPAGDGALEELRETVERASDLTSSLLAFGRRRVAAPKVLEFAATLEHPAPMLRRAVGERVRVEVESEAPDARICVDTSQLELVLLNLAVNGRDAMPEGGELFVRARTVEFSEFDTGRPPELEPGHYAAIQVADTGTGIAPDVLPRLFEPFFTTKPAGKGTGLGLATAHSIVRQMGGALRAESAQGKGATFSLFLPLTDEEVDVVDVSVARHSVGGTESVLLVEDDAGVSSMVTRVLSDLGYVVTQVESAEDALALETSFDLLLSDVRLPGRPGTELAEELAAAFPDLRILLMSGLVEDERQKAVIESGRFAFLPKPFVPEGLARRVREVLDE